MPIFTTYSSYYRMIELPLASMFQSELHSFNLAFIWSMPIFISSLTCLNFKLRYFNVMLFVGFIYFLFSLDKMPILLSQIISKHRPLYFIICLKNQQEIAQHLFFLCTFCHIFLTSFQESYNSFSKLALFYFIAINPFSFVIIYLDFV